MTYQNVLLVDMNDNPIGEAEKLQAHKQGLLHRAFSIFIYRKNAHGIEYLLQKRASQKYHCGGLWTNTCCSHPNTQKERTISVQERLKFEMGMDIPFENIKFIKKFTYKAVFDNGLTEHEIDHVFMAEYQGENIQPNPEEVDDMRWINLDILEDDLAKNPQNYTAWLPQVLHIAKKGLHNIQTFPLQATRPFHTSSS